jgi:hypothetical protein
MEGDATMSVSFLGFYHAIHWHPQICQRARIEVLFERPRGVGNCRVLRCIIDTAEVRVVLPLTMEGRESLDWT